MSKSSSELPSDQYYRAFSGDMSVVEAHINAKGDINAANEFGETFLHAAARSLNCDMVQYLLDRGANIEAKDSEGYTPFVATLIERRRLSRIRSLKSLKLTWLSW